jgi:RHS repeat-associated protein
VDGSSVSEALREGPANPGPDPPRRAGAKGVAPPGTLPRFLGYEHFQYTPYGESWVEEHLTTQLNETSHRFTGQELDEETGLYAFPARYYDPQTSRWWGADPAGAALMNPNGQSGGIRDGFSLIESTNWYSYVSNNPLRYSDPAGLMGNNEVDLPEDNQPWEWAYNDYRDSIEQRIRGRTPAEDALFRDNAPRGLVGMSDEAYGDLMMRWISADNDVSLKRIEIDDLLNSLYHTINRSEGLKDQAAIMLTAGAVAGAGEFSSTGSAQGLAETLLDAGNYASEYLDLHSAVGQTMGMIELRVDELQGLVIVRDSLERQYIGEYKRRRFIGGQ